MKDQTSAYHRDEIAVTFSLCLVVLAIPTNFRLVFYSLIALALSALAYAWRTRRIYRPPLFIQFLILAYIVRILWVFKANDLPYALKMLEGESALLLIPVIFLLFEISPEQKAIVSRFYILMGAGTSIFVFIKLYFHFTSTGLPWSEYLAMHFENAPYHSMVNILTWRSAHYSFITVIIIYGLHLLFYLDFKATRTKIIAVVIYTVLAILFIVVTGSIAGWFLLASAYISYALIRAGVLKMPRVVFAIVVLSYIALIVTTKPYYQKWEPARFTMISIAIDALKKSPLLGHGTGAGRELMHDKDFEYNYSYSVNHPHNQYLTELIQFGIIGSIPFFLFIVCSFSYAVKNLNKILFATLVTAALFMWIEAPLNSNKGLLPLVFLLCFAVKASDLKFVKTN